ncbi:MAG: universal stress protein [Lysobacteraceae bacterium]
MNASGTPIETLLAVTDFSEGAALALDRAARLAHDLGADLHIAHGVTLPTVIPAWGDPGGGAWVDASAIVDAAYEALEREADRIERLHGDRPKPHVGSGSTHRGMAEVARQVGADLVVVGARGRGFKLGRLLGSTAERLVRSLPMPVLVVRNPTAEGYRRAVIATDFSGPALAAARAVGRVAPDAERLLVHVHEDLYEQLAAYSRANDDQRAAHSSHAAGQAMAALKAELEQLQRDGLPASGVVRDGAATEVLPGYVEEVGADLLALGAHGRGGLEHLLLGSVSAWLLARVDCDVLVARD